jgi:hypothetical protein
MNWGGMLFVAGITLLIVALCTPWVDRDYDLEMEKVENDERKYL